MYVCYDASLDVSNMLVVAFTRVDSGTVFSRPGRISIYSNKDQEGRRATRPAERRTVYRSFAITSWYLGASKRIPAKKPGWIQGVDERNLGQRMGCPRYVVSPLFAVQERRALVSPGANDDLLFLLATQVHSWVHSGTPTRQTMPNADLTAGIKRACLVYYLLAWWGDGRHLTYSDQARISGQFAELTHAYFLLDIGNAAVCLSFAFPGRELTLD